MSGSNLESETKVTAPPDIPNLEISTTEDLPIVDIVESVAPNAHLEREGIITSRPKLHVDLPEAAPGDEAIPAILNPGNLQAIDVVEATLHGCTSRGTSLSRLDLT